MYIFNCEDSLDGIFTGIYDAYASHLGHNNIQLCSAPADNLELFCEYRQILPDSSKSEKVSRTLLERFGPEVYSELCQAILSRETILPRSGRRRCMDKAEAVYKTVVLGLSMKEQTPSILNHLSEPHVCEVFRLSRATGMEAHHLLGFLRFQELKNGVLLAIIHPKNHVLTILADHFTDRLPMENFMIYDESRQLAALHRAGKNFLIVDTSSMDTSLLHNYSDAEQRYQELWLGFFESIAIEARRNPKLQIQNIPKRFWADSVELRER